MNRPGTMTIPASVCRQISGVFFDIDDTFTYRGQIRREAFSALWEAKEAGLLLVPITGRPAGWVDHIARMWPVDGVVGENGGFYFCIERACGRLKKRFLIEDQAERQARLRQLYRIYAEIKSIYPAVGLASDQPYRECDLAVDYCEDIRPPLPLEVARAIRDIFEAHGATAKISSVHVNAWIGDYDKLAMCRLFLKEEHGICLEEQKHQYLYCGDSPNDCPMFAYFPNSAGVAGVRRFQKAGLLEHMPAYVASRDGSYGFQEILGGILKARQA